MAARRPAETRLRSIINQLAVAAAMAVTTATLAQAPAPPPPPDAPGAGQDGDRGQRRDRGDFPGGRRGQGGPGGFAGGFGPGGMGGFAERMRDMFRTDFSNRDLPFFKDELKLDSMQQFVFETMIEDYDSTFNQSREELQTKFAQLGPQQFFGGQRGQQGENPERQAMREKMRQRFQELREEIEKARLEMGDQVDNEKLRQMFRERAEALRAEFGDIAPQMPQMQDIQKLMADMSADMDKWRTRKIELRERLIADMQNQLTKEQMDLWPAFDRKLRRVKTLTRGQLSGESVDLFQLVRELELDDAAKVKADPVLTEYDLALDAALKARNDYIEQTQKDLYQAMQEMNTTRGLALIEQQTRLHAAVRDVNVNFAETLATALPEEKASELRKEFAERAFDRVYRTTQTQRMFKAAKEIPGLDPAVLASLESLEQSYLTELAAANERLVQITRLKEPEQVVERVRQTAARFTGREAQEWEDPIRAAFEQRNQMGERHQKQIQALLTPEQFASLAQSARQARRDGQGPAAQRRGRDDAGGDAVDTNGDGRIDDAERAAAIRAAGERIYRGGGTGGGDENP